MGAWGYKLEENDVAQDAILDFKNRGYLKTERPNLVQIFNKIKGDNDAVLGLAEYLLRKKINLLPVRSIVLKSLKRELRPTALLRWDYPDQREYVLRLFESRILGKPAPKRPIKESKQKGSRLKLKARERKGKWGFVNAKGRFVIKPKYDHAEEFTKEGLALVRRGFYPRGLYHGMIDEKGKEVVPLLYEAIGDISEGLMWVRRQDGKTGFVNLDGREVIKPQYKKAKDFSEGLTAVMVGERWGFIDRAGRWVVKPTFQWVSRFYRGKAYVTYGIRHKKIIKNGKTYSRIEEEYRLINKKGQLISVTKNPPPEKWCD